MIIVELATGWFADSSDAERSTEALEVLQSMKRYQAEPDTAGFSSTGIQRRSLYMGHVCGFKNETDLTSLSSAVCLASAMPVSPPGAGGPHPPADCECRLCRTFRKVASLVFGAESNQVFRDRCQPYFEGLYTQLLEIALEVRGTAASSSGEAANSGQVRPGGPPPAAPAGQPAEDPVGRGDQVKREETPGQAGVKQEEQEVAPVVAPHQKRGPSAKPTTKSSEEADAEGGTSAGSRPEVETEEREEFEPKARKLPPLPRQRRGGYDQGDSPRRRRRRERSGKRRRDVSRTPGREQELHPKAAPSSRRPRTPLRSPPSVHTPEDRSSSGGAPRGDTTRFRGTSLELASGQEDEETPHTLPAAEESEEAVELPEEEVPELEAPEPNSPPTKGKGRGKGKGSKGKKGKKSKPKKKNRGLKKTWRNIEFYANKRRDPTWRRSGQ